MKKIVSKNHLWMNIVAGVLVLAMLVCDVNLIGILTASTDVDTTVIKEEHKMQEYLADGDYGGNKSDYEYTGTWGGVSSGGVPVFGILNILEIVPDRRCGYVGYMEEGCEPIADNKIDRAYMMDAMVNNSPGSQYNDASQSQYYFNGMFGNINTGSTPIVGREHGNYDGYFLKVEPGKGVYALCGNTVSYVSNSGRDSDVVKSVVMTSKFAMSPAGDSHGGYDYVWVDVEYSAGAEKPTTTRHDINNMAVGDKIYLENYPKFKYKNSNLFADLFFGEPIASDDIRVFTRTPDELAAEPELVDNVDIIFLSANVDTACTEALDTYRGVYGNGDSTKSYSTSNDIPFDQVLKIYDRVVCKENLSIVTSHALWTSDNLNIQHLIFMLYCIEKKNENNSKVTGSGRDFIKNFIPAYYDDMEELTKVSFDGNGYRESAKAADFVYISDDGKFVCSDKYNDCYFNQPQGGTKFNFSQYTTNGDTDWHATSFEDRWLLQWAWGQKNNSGGNQIFPLYTYFKKGYKAENDPGLGSYRNQYIHNDNGMTFRCGAGGELGDIASSFRDYVKPNKIVPDPSLTGGSDKTRIVYLTVNITNGSSKSSGDSTVSTYKPNKNMYINQYELENEKIKDQFVFEFTLKSTTPITNLKAKIGTNTYTFNYTGSSAMEPASVAIPQYMADYLHYSCGGASIDLTCEGIDAATMADVAAKLDAAIAADTAHAIYPADYQYEVGDIYKYKGKLKVSDLDPNLFTNIKPNTDVSLEAITDLDVEYNDGTTGKLTAIDRIKIVVRNFFQLN